MEIVATLLKKGQSERIIKKMGIDELLMFIGGTISAYLRWYFTQEKAKPSSLKNQIQMVWDGIKA